MSGQWRFAAVEGTDLPIFRADVDGRTVFYAPRLPVAVPVEEAEAVERALTDTGAGGAAHALAGACPDARTAVAARLAAAARAALEWASAAAVAPFAPEGLTLFLNNACALACSYCHAAPGVEPDVPLSDAVLTSAARLVGASCVRRGMPMTLALHGGGEPLLDLADAKRVLSIVREAAADVGAPLRTYVATGGVIPAETARWAAREFDLIGLSCDGPPDIQDAHRPTRAGTGTSAAVERTADALRESGARFHVRATVTAGTIDRQAEIVRYAITRLGPCEVRLEPVYSSALRPSDLTSGDAERFVDGFLAARRTGAAEGVPVTTSLVRPHELYGPHCNVARAVVNLVPGDVATGCFLASRAPDIDARGVRVGDDAPRTSGEIPAFFLDYDRIAVLGATACERPAECVQCPCVLQCALGCPDVCVLEPGALGRHVGSFRCRAQRLLMEALVLEEALS